MATNPFITQLAETSGIAPERLPGLSEALISLITTLLTENKSIAIPGFGTFEPRKEMERIVVNAETGKRSLVPPAITVCFTPGSRLKKAVANS